MNRLSLRREFFYLSISTDVTVALYMRVFRSSLSYQPNFDGTNTITSDTSIPGAFTSMYVAVTLDELTLYNSYILGLMYNPEPEES